MDTPDQAADTQSEAEAVIAQIDGDPAPNGDETPPDAPSNEETSADQAPEESFTTFNLADVPDDYRDYVEAARRSMQADYSRKTAELAQQRKFFEDRGIDPNDPQAAFQALASELGYELDDEDTDQPDPDLPDSPFDPNAYGGDPDLETRLAALEAERIEEQQRTSDLQSLSEDLDYIRAKLGREPSEAEIDFYGRHALRDNGGRLGIRGVFDATESLMGERQQAYRASKQAPRVQAGGTAGVTAHNLDDPEERLKATEEIFLKAISET